MYSCDIFASLKKDMIDYNICCFYFFSKLDMKFILFAAVFGIMMIASECVVINIEALEYAEI